MVPNTHKPQQLSNTLSKAQFRHIPAPQVTVGRRTHFSTQNLRPETPLCCHSFLFSSSLHTKQTCFPSFRAEVWRNLPMQGYISQRETQRAFIQLTSRTRVTHTESFACFFIFLKKNKSQ